MRTLVLVALLLSALGARAQDGKDYNYYGDDQQQPPQPAQPPSPQVTRPIPGPQATPPQPTDDWQRFRGRGGLPPPPPQPEARPPGQPGQVWIGGFWAPRGASHVWVPGHYAVPPGPGYAWQDPRWQNVSGEWIFYEGHWYLAAQPPQQIPFQPPPPSMIDEWTDQPPPPPLAEYAPVQPFPNAIWIPGYWHWNGIRYGWVTGRWSANPPWYFWQGHRWVRSPDGHFREEPGYWHR